jgi:DNA-binding protein HU-beta
MEKPAAKSAATSKAAKVESVTLKQISTELAKKHELSNKAAALILDDFVGLVTKQLKKGSRIRLTGLGILSVRKRAARMGRNPATGEAIKIKASEKVSFRASKELKESV